MIIVSQFLVWVCATQCVRLDINTHTHTYVSWKYRTKERNWWGCFFCFFLGSPARHLSSAADNVRKLVPTVHSLGTLYIQRPHEPELLEQNPLWAQAAVKPSGSGRVWAGRYKDAEPSRFLEIPIILLLFFLLKLLWLVKTQCRTLSCRLK